jgi:hypothetical protein
LPEEAGDFVPDLDLLPLGAGKLLTILADVDAVTLTREFLVRAFSSANPAIVAHRRTAVHLASRSAAGMRKSK